MSSHSHSHLKTPPNAKYPDGAELETLKGGCHCRKFTFNFKHPSLELLKPVSCNCTFCTKSGTINMFGPETMFHLADGSASWSELSTFVAKTNPITHNFCPGCGCYLFWNGIGLVGVNVRTLDGIEIEKLSFDVYDGRSKP